MISERQITNRSLESLTTIVVNKNKFIEKALAYIKSLVRDRLHAKSKCVLHHLLNVLNINVGGSKVHKTAAKLLLHKDLGLCMV